MWESVDLDLLQEATLETLHMVGISTLMTAVLGIPLGVLLVVTDRGYFWENLVFQRILAFVVNIFRAVPFIILVLFLFPVAKLLVETTLGPTAATIPLIAGAAPFYARMVETAIRDIDRGVIEAAQAMGASRLTIICKVLIPEAFPSIVSGLTVTCVSLISFSAMAGIVGAGGLGDTAYRFGFQAFNDAMLYSCGILLVVLVQLVRGCGGAGLPVPWIKDLKEVKWDEKVLGFACQCAGCGIGSRLRQPKQGKYACGRSHAGSACGNFGACRTAIGKTRRGKLGNQSVYGLCFAQ